MLQINRMGVTRIVLLTKNYAFKIPNFSYGWRMWLQGRLANGQESRISKEYCAVKDKICPVLFSLPMGYLVIMPRVKVMSEQEFSNFNYNDWINLEDGIKFECIEKKAENFGYLDNKVVAIDYGGFYS